MATPNATTLTESEDILLTREFKQLGVLPRPLGSDRDKRRYMWKN